MNKELTSQPTLLLPGDPGFEDWLGIPPPADSNPYWVADKWGNLRAVTFEQLIDYAYGGEYEEVIEDDQELVEQLHF